MFGARRWKRRLSHLAQYFSAYRIDHILGFCRIWEIPGDCATGAQGRQAWRLVQGQLCLANSVCIGANKIWVKLSTVSCPSSYCDTAVLALQQAHHGITRNTNMSVAGLQLSLQEWQVLISAVLGHAMYTRCCVQACWATSGPAYPSQPRTWRCAA